MRRPLALAVLAAIGAVGMLAGPAQADGSQEPPFTVGSAPYSSQGCVNGALYEGIPGGGQFIGCYGGREDYPSTLNVKYNLY